MTLEPRRLTRLEDIARVVAGYVGIRVRDLQSAHRHRHIVAARNTCFYLARLLTDLSLPVIGGFFGGRHHATVLHGIDQVERSLAHAIIGPATLAELKALEARAKAAFAA